VARFLLHRRFNDTSPTSNEYIARELSYREQLIAQDNAAILKYKRRNHASARARFLHIIELLFRLCERLVTKQAMSYRFHGYGIVIPLAVLRLLCLRIRLELAIQFLDAVVLVEQLRRRRRRKYRSNGKFRSRWRQHWIDLKRCILISRLHKHPRANNPDGDFSEILLTGFRGIRKS